MTWLNTRSHFSKNRPSSHPGSPGFAGLFPNEKLQEEERVSPLAETFISLMSTMARRYEQSPRIFRRYTQ